MKVMIDGTLMDGEHAQVPVLDHGFLYGDGVFEGIRAVDGSAFQLDEHLTRLLHGMRALGLEVEGGIATLRESVTTTLEAHEGGQQYVRLIVSRGDGPLGIDPFKCAKPRVVSIVDQLTVFSPEQRRTGLSLITSSLRRPGADTLDPRVKTLNYLNNIQAKAEALRQGADDALMLNQAGHVAEASVANLFIVRDRTLLTPPSTDGCLDGITRATVLGLARGFGIATAERTLGRIDVLTADECFLTGTGAGLIRVASLDGQAIGRGEIGPISAQLMQAHEKLSG